MTTLHGQYKLEIQRRREEIRILQGMISTSDPGGAAPVPVASRSYPKKSLPHHVKRKDAEEGFRKMPVAFTSKESSHQLRDQLGVVITPGCAYNWLRNFLAEGLVTQGPRVGKFRERTWTKTAKGLTSRWHDRARSPAV